jgi:hypothetical protein
MTQDEIDARRYRWLRGGTLDRLYESVPHVLTGNEHQAIDVSIFGDELDAAVDAAMADEPRYTITAKGRELLEGK